MQNPIFVTAQLRLPKEEVNLEKWAVVACDQYTSEPEYWEKVDQLVGEAPSTLRIILPEVFLEQEDTAHKIGEIHAVMEEYSRDVLTRTVDGFIYVEREVEGGTRQGLVGCVDLEAYQYKPNTFPAIRPSENTVEERIPPRLAVRRGAQLESPHILMLCDDMDRQVLEPLGQKTQDLEKLYDFTLMEGGGRIQGWAVTSPQDIQQVLDGLDQLANPQVFHKKYGTTEETRPFVLAVGDGNHSLATAKASWEEIKPTLTAQQQASHPARFCCVELENVQSPANQIEPIHRIITGISGDDFMRAVGTYTRESGARLAGEGPLQCFSILQAGQPPSKIYLEDTPLPLTVATVEAILEICQRQNPLSKIDYIHGQQSLQQLVESTKGVGILLPPFEKADLFRGVALGGVLPKKTFSMGHAHEKRYYLECRTILT